MSLFKKSVVEKRVDENIVDINDAKLKSHSVERLYAFLDKASMKFDVHFFNAQVDEHAVRMVEAGVVDDRALISKYPDSYALYHVGYFILETGKLVTMDSPRLIVEVKPIFNKVQTLKGKGVKL